MDIKVITWCAIIATIIIVIFVAAGCERHGITLPLTPPVTERAQETPN